MKMIREFYRKHFRKKLFNKILAIYFIITILSLTVLAAFVYRYLAASQVQKELAANQQLLSSISAYLDSRYAASQHMYRQIYEDESSTLLADVQSFLTRSFSDYLDSRIALYLETGVRRRDISLFLRQQLWNDPSIQSISLYSAKEQFLYVLTKDSQHYAESVPDLKTALEQHVLTRESLTTVSNIADLTRLETIGNLIVDYNAAGIYKAFHGNWAGRLGYVVVLTPDGDVVFDSSGRYTGMTYPYNSRIDPSRNSATLEEASFVNVQAANRFGYRIAGVIPKSEITEGLTGLRNTLFLVTLGIIAGATAITYFTIIHFSRRTRVIVKALDRVRDGDLSVRIPEQKEDELFLISDRFNRMCEDLSRHIDRVYISEIRQRQAELVAFQAQIKPHFLYNTLEAIRMRALHKKADDVAEMIYILSTLFRYSVKSETIVTLGDEIEYCSLYMDLFRIRYGNNFSYEIDIEPELMGVSVLKLSIQPIIENYIVHGLVMSRSDNRIRIQAELGPCGDVIIVIEDNGRGITPDRLEWIRQRLGASGAGPKTGSIGLINTCERMKICFGPDFGLAIASKPGQGAIVTMNIPAEQGGIEYAQRFSSG